jgi:hypothetical protein
MKTRKLLVLALAMLLVTCWIVFRTDFCGERTANSFNPFTKLYAADSQPFRRITARPAHLHHRSQN